MKETLHLDFPPSCYYTSHVELDNAQDLKRLPSNAGIHHNQELIAVQ